MRYMLLIKSDQASEAGEMPEDVEELINAMGQFNARMVSAGILLGGEGLLPSSEGVRVTTTKGEQTVTDGPFAEAKELIGGFWLIDVASKEEAVQWAREVPLGEDGEIEVRRVVEADDFGEGFTPEAREAEDRLRERIAEQHPEGHLPSQAASGEPERA